MALSLMKDGYALNPMRGIKYQIQNLKISNLILFLKKKNYLSFLMYVFVAPKKHTFSLQTELFVSEMISLKLDLVLRIAKLLPDYELDDRY